MACLSSSVKDPIRRKLKFIYSEKTTNFCKIFIADLSYVVTIKSTVEISKKFVAFSEYMNFKRASYEIVVNSSILAVVFLLQISGSVFCCKNI